VFSVERVHKFITYLIDPVEIPYKDRPLQVKWLDVPGHHDSNQELIVSRSPTE